MAKKKAKRAITVKRTQRGVTIAGPAAEITEALSEAVKSIRTEAEEPLTEWERQPGIEKQVTEMVEKFHAHLTRARIIVLGKPKASKAKGKVNVAKAKLASPAIQALLKDASGVDVHYLIEVGMDAWEGLSAKQKRAILDHELHHFTGMEVDDKGREKWGLCGHDVEEFTAVVRRHGAYHPALEIFVTEIKQLKLPGVE